MSDLPVRLAKGDPAPEDGVLVPLYGPIDNDITPWRSAALVLAQAGFAATALSLHTIIDAAEATRRLRKGDRVRIGDVEAVFVEFHPMSSEFCWVDYTGSPLGMTHRVPLSAITRIDDKPCPNCDGRKCMACVARETHPGKCVDDCPDCCLDDGDEPEFDPDPMHYDDFKPNHIDRHGTASASASEAGGLKTPGPTTDWTPAEGMLVERISDGECFRLGLGGGDWPWFLTSSASCGSSRHPDSYNTQGICSQFRPRYLCVGDVISAVNEDTSHPVAGEAIIAFTPQGLTTDFHRTRHDHDIVVHIEGLGPVPWPPTEEGRPMSDPQIEHQLPYCIECCTEVDSLDDGVIRCSSCGATWIFNLRHYNHYEFSSYTTSEGDEVDAPLPPPNEEADQ